MNSPIDLTPFGFTPTESSAYSDLLAGGPSTGYQIAKRLGIARANAYQALDGLAAKGAAQILGDRPKRYRAAGPDTVMAQIIDRQSRQLDRLEAQVLRMPSNETEDIVVVEGQRAILDLAMRTVARQPGPIWCLGKSKFLAGLAPAWRRRATDGRETRTWVVGSGEVPGSEIRGRISEELVHMLFRESVFLLAGDDASIAAIVGETNAKGVWSSEPVLVGAVKASITALTDGIMINGPHSDSG